MPATQNGLGNSQSSFCATRCSEDASPSADLNIRAVADLACVSKSTVSHVLSGKPPVSVATRRRVEQVVDDLGYQPDFIAQAHTRNRSNTIALIVQGITNPYYPARARGLQTTSSGHDQVRMRRSHEAQQLADSGYSDSAVQADARAKIGAAGLSHLAVIGAAIGLPKP
jgi:transcriptional regulator with XRE-family HTH domain